jgi:hypothetical protein
MEKTLTRFAGFEISVIMALLTTPAGITPTDGQDLRSVGV